MPSPTTVTGVDFVTVFVKDYPAALKFYGDTLGLEHSVDYEKIPAGEASSSSPRRSTAASATWPSSPIPTATP